MTVKELKEILEDYPDDATVDISISEFYGPLRDVTVNLGRTYIILTCDWREDD